MTPTRAAEILESWASKAKTDESRMVCEMAAIALRNGALSREILAVSGELTINVVKDGNAEFFAVYTRTSQTIGAPTLAGALEGLREKVIG